MFELYRLLLTGKYDPAGRTHDDDSSECGKKIHDFAKDEILKKQSPGKLSVISQKSATDAFDLKSFSHQELSYKAADALRAVRESEVCCRECCVQLTMPVKYTQKMGLYGSTTS